MPLPTDRYVRAGATPDEVEHAQELYDRLPASAQVSLEAEIAGISDGDLQDRILAARQAAVDAESADNVDSAVAPVPEVAAELQLADETSPAPIPAEVDVTEDPPSDDDEADGA